MKRIFMLSIIAAIFLVGCSKKGKTVLNENTVSNSDNKVNKIEIALEEYKEKDNLYPENIIKIDKKDIDKIYWSKNFGSYEIAVGLDKNDTMNIIYIKDRVYTSVCQESNWTDGYEYAFENDDVDHIITRFENVLGESGVKITVPVGAAAVDIFYLTIDQEEPSLLLSASVSSGFTEFDIDEDGTKELLSFDEYMYIKINDTIYKATYVYDENLIQIVNFNAKLEDFIVYFSDKTNKEYMYDSKQRCLVEKQEN